jgi:hypothetical protein
MPTMALSRLRNAFAATASPERRPTSVPVCTASAPAGPAGRVHVRAGHSSYRMARRALGGRPARVAGNRRASQNATRGRSADRRERLGLGLARGLGERSLTSENTVVVFTSPCCSTRSARRSYVDRFACGDARAFRREVWICRGSGRRRGVSLSANVAAGGGENSSAAPRRNFGVPGGPSGRFRILCFGLRVHVRADLGFFS